MVPSAREAVSEMLTLGPIQVCLPLREQHVLCDDDPSVIELAILII